MAPIRCILRTSPAHYVLLFAVCLPSCSRSAPVDPASAPTTHLETSSQQDEPPSIALPTNTKQRIGDLDVLVKHRVIRIAVAYSKTNYFVVAGEPRGMAYQAGKTFENYLNRKYPPKNKHIKIHVLFLPVPRDKLLPYVAEGHADIAIAQLTITPEREKVVDFSNPAVSDVSEILVTGPQSPPITSVDDLSGKELFLRRSSSYWEHVGRLNGQFTSEGKPAVTLRAVPEDLEDDDLLEMVNAGLLPATIVDDYSAKLWSKFLPQLQLHPGIAVNRGGEFAWAIRKNSPQLLAAVNGFLKTHGQSTAFGAQLINQYMRSTQALKHAISPVGIKRFERTEALFRKYSARYHEDYLLMMAKGYQESRLNQAARSRTGAIGIMQLMPATGAAMKVGDIHQLEPNIHAGLKYFAITMKQLYGAEPIDDMNKALFTLAAYNCGPARVKRLRREAAQKGLDPDVWFDNVEMIAAARVGNETVSHVSNVYKYYVAYKLIAVQEEQRKNARQSLEHQLR